MMNIREYNGVSAPDSLRTEKAIWYYLRTSAAIAEREFPENDKLLHKMDSSEASEHRKTALMYAKHLQTLECIN